MLTKYISLLFGAKQKRVVPVSSKDEEDHFDSSLPKKKDGPKKSITKPSEPEDNVHFGTFRHKQRVLQESYATLSRGNDRKHTIASGAVGALPGIAEGAAPNQAVLVDCLEFVHGLNLQPQRGRQELLANDLCGAVLYEHDGFESLRNNPLGSFLLRAVLNKTNFLQQGNVNIEEFNMLMIATDSATTLIDYQRNMEEGLSSSQSFWIPLHGCLALTDICLLAVHRYIDACARLTDDSFENIALSVDCLFIKFHSLGPMLECESDNTIRLLFCQSAARSCLVIQSLICVALARSHGSNSGNSTKLVLRLIQLLQSLAPNISLCRQVCGEMARDVSILFWAECDSVVDRVLSLSITSGVIQRMQSGKRSIRTGGEYLNVPSSGAVGSLTMKLTTINRVRHALLLTIPTPQELFMEICRLKNANPRNSTMAYALDGIDDDADCSSQAIGGDNDPMSLVFLKLKHALAGFQFLLRIASIDAKEMKLSMPNVDDWISSLAESIFVVLNTYNEGPQSQLSQTGFEFLIGLAPMLHELFFHVYVGADVSPHYDWIFWEITKRVSALVEMNRFHAKKLRTSRSRKFEMRMNSASPRSQEEYTDRSSSNTALVQSGRGGVAPNSAADSGHSSSSTRVSDYHQQNGGKPAKSGSGRKQSARASGESTPDQGKRPPTVLSPISQTISQLQRQKYSIGQQVQGLVKMSSGAERWFPGKVSFINLDGTYDIDYDDGDFQKCKHVNELRPLNGAKPPVSEASIKRASRDDISQTFDRGDSGSSTQSHESVSNSNPITVGEAVLGLVKNRNGLERWAKGVVIGFNSINSTYDLHMQDGTIQRQMTKSDIRRKRIRSKVHSSQPLAVEVPQTKVSQLAISPKLVSPCKLPAIVSINMSALPAEKVSTASSKPAFEIGQLVDGLVKLSNGNQRWFPGKIVLVHPNMTYDIQYNDGDFQQAKPASEIRQTRRVPKAAEPIVPLAAASEPTVSVTSPIFLLNDAVDGLVKLKNGTERWFPGTVSGVNDDGTFDIAYNDGTSETKKSSTRIRVTKKRVLQPQSKPTEFSPEELNIKLQGVANQSKQYELGFAPPPVITEKQSAGLLANCEFPPVAEKPAIPPVSEAISNKSSFTVGDAVMGMVTLPNGTVRWFPGKITAFVSSVSVDVTFDDGDIHRDKPLSEIKAKRAAAPVQSLEVSPCSSVNQSVNHSAHLSEAGPVIGEVVEMKRQVSNFSSSSTMSSPIRGDELWVSVKIIYINLDGTVDVETPDGQTEKFISVFDLRRKDGKKLAMNSPFHSSRAASSIQSTSRSNRSQISSPRSIASLVVTTVGGDPTTTSVVPVMETIVGSRSDSIHSAVDEVTDVEQALLPVPSVKQSLSSPVILSKPDVVDSDDDSEDGFYAIPSVFAGGLIRKENVGVIPGISIAKVNFGVKSGNVAGPNGSLSASLLHNDDKDEAESLDFTGRKHPFAAMSRSDSGALAAFEVNDASHRSMSVGGFSRMMSWREMREPSILTKRNFNDNEPSETFGLADLQNRSLDLPLNELFDKDEDEPAIPETLMKSYYVMVIILLRRSIIDKYFMDHACCSARIISNSSHMHFSTSASITTKGFGTGRSRGGGSERPSSARSESAVSNASVTGPPALKHINLIYNLSEFLEMMPPMSDNFLYLAEVANTMGPNYSRVLKLMHQQYFQSCLPSHIETAEKLGEGGFGTIFRITCPDSCGEVAARRRVLNPLQRMAPRHISSSKDGRRKVENCPSWRKCNCKTFIHNPSRLTAACNQCGSILECSCNAQVGMGAGIQYAVKRIPRCRSVHDAQIVSAVYNEITSLAALEGIIGVCQLVDFGVHLSEYWLVMELCGPNLSEWRRRTMDASSSTSPARKSLSLKEEFSGEQLSVKDAGTCLTAFVDILFIIKSVHAADVGHFDIKCNNFVMKLEGSSSPFAPSVHPESFSMLNDMRILRDAHEQNKPSGQIVLIDFGEAMPYMSAPKSRSSIASTSAKCRGTLCIQSPEIISISSTANASKQNNTGQIKFPLPSKPSDIWSLGCLLVELLSGQYLFVDRPWADLYVTLCRKKFDENTIPMTLVRRSLELLPKDVQDAVEQLLLSIMKQVPSERPQIDEIIRKTNNILSHYIFTPYLRDYSKSARSRMNAENNDLIPSSSQDLQSLRAKVLEDIVPLTVQLGDSNVVLSDSVMLRVEATPPHPIVLSTQFALEVEADRHHETDRKPSLLVARAPSFSEFNEGVASTDMASSLLSQFEVVDKLIGTSDLSRVVKDVGSRLIRSWSLQGNLLQIMIISSRAAKVSVYKNVSKYGQQDSVQTVLVSPDDLQDLLPSVSRAFNRGCRALSYHQKVIITVNPLDDHEFGPDMLPTYSKLAISIATAMADGLSIWSSAGSGRSRAENSMLLNSLAHDQINTTHNVGNYAQDIESACCRRIIEIVLEYCDREADHTLAYSKPLH